MKNLVSIELKIDPKPKPRMVRSDRWRKRPCVLKYWEFKDRLVELATVQGYEIQKPLSLTFVIPMPKSWSDKKKKEMLGKDHEQTPDLDNLIKAFKDCLTDKDEWISRYDPMLKIWGTEGRIMIHL